MDFKKFDLIPNILSFYNFNVRVSHSFSFYSGIAPAVSSSASVIIDS